MCIKFASSSAGIAGVYDIETHYQYEFGRGVAELSTMKRAIGGRLKFQSQSPALILNTACGRKTKVRVPEQATGPAVEAPVDSRSAMTGCHHCMILKEATLSILHHGEDEATLTLHSSWLLLLRLCQSCHLWPNCC